MLAYFSAAGIRVLEQWGSHPRYNQALPLLSWGQDSYFWICLIGPPQMASCGFQISPKANVAQLGDCSSNELTSLKIMIFCPLKSSGVALVAPLPPHTSWDPFRGKTDRKADRCHWGSFYSKSKWVAGAFQDLFKMWDVAFCFLALLRCAYAKSPPEEIWTELWCWDAAADLQ